MPGKLKVGFLGAGRMATALAKGFVRAGLATPKDLIASDPVPGACAAFARETSAKATSSNTDVAKFAQVLILAVKPDQTAAVLSDIRDHFTPKHLLISIAAGVPLSKLEGALGSSAR